MPRPSACPGRGAIRRSWPAGCRTRSRARSPRTRGPIEATAGRAFAFRRPWLADESVVTTVRVTITPSGYGTRLRLEDGPFQLDQPGGIDAWAEALQAWSEAIAMLRAYLDFSVDIRPRQ